MKTLGHFALERKQIRVESVGIYKITESTVKANTLIKLGSVSYN